MTDVDCYMGRSIPRSPLTLWCGHGVFWGDPSLCWFYDGCFYGCCMIHIHEKRWKWEYLAEICSVWWWVVIYTNFKTKPMHFQLHQESRRKAPLWNNWQIKSTRIFVKKVSIVLQIFTVFISSEINLLKEHDFRGVCVCVCVRRGSHAFVHSLACSVTIEKSQPLIVGPLWKPNIRVRRFVFIWKI